MQRPVSVAIARWIASCLALAVLCLTAVAFADPRAERDAQALQKTAIEQDSLNMNYAGAIRKLQTASNRCGSNRCSGAIKAAVLRDLGAMQILAGKVEDGKASFGRALGLDSSLELDPSYKNPMLEGIWEEAKKKAAGGGGGGAAAGGSSQPEAGDFTHTPPPEALVRTPLALYVEYPAGDLARVVIRYKGEGMSSWKGVELKKVGDGYGGLIPCKDVTQGTMQYYIQGFDSKNQPLAMSGSRTAPFTVAVSPQISGAVPSLPGRAPPSQCGGGGGESGGGESSSGAPDCPPDFPGCIAPKKENGRSCSKDEQCSSSFCSDGKCADKKGSNEDCDSDDECSSGQCADGKCSDKKGTGDYCERDEDCASGSCNDSKCGGASASGGLHRFWIGVGVQADFYAMPAAQNACQLNPATGGKKAINNAGYYCVDPATNANFPGGSATLNDQISSGGVGAGIKFGNLRILASADYAITENIMAGLRFGYVLFTDPATGKPSKAFAPIQIEARFTYVFGHDALSSKTAVSPMVLVGGGVGEFDAFIPLTVGFTAPAGSMMAAPSASLEHAWLTAGPGFLNAGGGIRVKLGSRAAMNIDVKLEGAFGGTAGFLFGIAPEAGIQFGL